jgi:hypothetical protein
MSLAAVWFEWRLRRLLNASLHRPRTRKLTGLKEWSDREVVRLPSWTRHFTRQQRFLARVLSRWRWLRWSWPPPFCAEY